MAPLRAGLVALLLALLFSPSASAELVADPDGDVAAPDGLSGREIYDRVVAHRLRSFYFDAELENGNGKGDKRRLSFRLIWKDFRDEDPEVLSRTKIELDEPFFLRFGGLLIEKKRGEPAQQWAYLPEFRLTVRVSMRALAIHGSAFAFDDIIPPEAEDFTYRRRADDVYEGKPVYVLEGVPRAHTLSNYSRILVSVDKARDIPLRSRYWNAAGLEIRELSFPPASLERFGRSWFPMLATIRDLRSGEFSTIRLGRFVANPELGRSAFDLRRLESH